MNHAKAIENAEKLPQDITSTRVVKFSTINSIKLFFGKCCTSSLQLLKIYKIARQRLRKDLDIIKVI